MKTWTHACLIKMLNKYWITRKQECLGYFHLGFFSAYVICCNKGQSWIESDGNLIPILKKKEGLEWVVFCFLASVSETPVIMCNYLLCRKLVLKDVESTLCSFKKNVQNMQFKKETVWMWRKNEATAVGFCYAFSTKSQNPLNYLSYRQALYCKRWIQLQIPGKEMCAF